MQKTKYSFWADAADQEYFIVKQKNGPDKLTAEIAVQDHIANAIYRLCGVCTPDLFIGYYQNQLSLFSRILPGYQDLFVWLNSEDALEEINRHHDVDECIQAYKKIENTLSIHGKENLLAAAIILEDTDVIGAGFRNIGLIESNNQHQIIKIDPSNSIFDIPKEMIDTILIDFKNNLSMENPFIYSSFSFNVLFNNPKSIVGNLHISEFFHDIDKEKLKIQLARFANLDDTYIRTLIMRDEYLEVLDMDNKKLYLEQLCTIILSKKAILKKFLNVPEMQTKPPDLTPVFIKNLTFSEPLEHIKHGASQPFKVKKISSPALVPEPLII